MDVRLPVTGIPEARGRAFFDLEASQEGIRLRMAQAFLEQRLMVRDLRMEIRGKPQSLDLSAGPRLLRSLLATLEGLEVRVDLTSLRWRTPEGFQVGRILPIEGGRRLWVGCRYQDVPFSLRCRVLASERPGFDLEMRLEEPRVFGWIGTPWHRLGERILTDVRRTWFRMERGMGSLWIDLLSPMLRGLLAERGWKVPDRRGVRLLRTGIEGNAWFLRFDRPGNEDTAGGTEPPPRPAEPLQEGEIRMRLREGRPVDGDLLIQGLDHPRLWPEILGRCREVSEERPEQVEASLVAILLAQRGSDLATPEDRFRWLRRLVMGLASQEAGIEDLRWGAGWVGEVARGLPPDATWALLEEMLSLGVVEPDLLRVASVCLDRLGRHREAEALRNRMIAIAEAEELEELVQRTLATLDQEGLSRVADDWIERLATGQAGVDVPDFVIRRTLRKTDALRRMVRDSAIGLDRWMDLLEEDPWDLEVRDFVRLAIQSDSQANEVATRVVEMAGDGPGRRDLLRYAASLVENRPGLRGKAVRWYEESLDGEPNPGPVLESLERLHRLLGRDRERMALLDRCIAADPESPRSLGWRIERARRAIEDRDDRLAKRLLREVLDRDPTHREALALAREVHRRLGEEDAVREVEEVLRDLGEDRSSVVSPPTEVTRCFEVIRNSPDPDRMILDLSGLVAKASERPESAGMVIEALRTLRSDVDRRWGPSASADLEVLISWADEVLQGGSPELPSKCR